MLLLLGIIMIATWVMQTSDDFDVTHDPYSWGTFHVNRQSIEQGNKLKMEMHLHFVPGPEISPPSASSIQAN